MQLYGNNSALLTIIGRFWLLCQRWNYGGMDGDSPDRFDPKRCRLPSGDIEHYVFYPRFCVPFASDGHLLLAEGSVQTGAVSRITWRKAYERRRWNGGGVTWARFALQQCRVCRVFGSWTSTSRSIAYAPPTINCCPRIDCTNMQGKRRYITEFHWFIGLLEQKSKRCVRSRNIYDKISHNHWHPHIVLQELSER